MKQKIYLALLILASLPGFSQYTVTKVIGAVQVKGSGEWLKQGSKLSDNDVLLFSTANDLVRAIVAGKGIYLITPSPRAEKKPNALAEMLKTTLQVKAKEAYLSGRSDEETIPEALLPEKAASNFTLVASQNPYLFNKRTYDVAGGNKFFLQLEIPGSAPVIRQLRTSGDTLFVHAADFNPGVITDTSARIKYKLGFYTRDKRSSELLASVVPYLDSANALETIVEAMVSGNKPSDSSTLRQECYSEVCRSLGKPSIILFNRIFDRSLASAK